MMRPTTGNIDSIYKQGQISTCYDFILPDIELSSKDFYGLKKNNGAVPTQNDL